MTILPNFTVTDIQTSGARIRLRHAGTGPGLLLLHGNPLTHVAWHKIAPRLAERQFTGFNRRAFQPGGVSHFDCRAQRLPAHRR